MSANIYWEPVQQTKKSLDVPAPSEFMQRMEKLFGSFPINLTSEDIPYLKGLAATNYKPAEDIIALIDKYQSVRIWAEF